MTESHPTERQERTFELAGWPVRLVSYALRDRFYCTIDNVDPGAVVARAWAHSRGEAEEAATARAEERLVGTSKRRETLRMLRESVANLELQLPKRAPDSSRG